LGRERSLTFLDELTTAKLRESRAWWNNGALTTQRKHHRLNGFFDFCIETDWLLRNPAKKDQPLQRVLQVEALSLQGLDLARKVHELYFDPQDEEFQPRTMWSLSNAFPSAFKELDPIPQFRATAKLGRFLEATPAM
jgi:hypothetical protein